jgi:hypothetical protein
LWQTLELSASRLAQLRWLAIQCGFIQRLPSINAGSQPDLKVEKSLDNQRSDFLLRLFTCMVKSEQIHLHFVDGNNGGYTAAARDMKARETARRLSNKKDKD